jgi:ferredoxin-NADP reductase
MTAGPDSDLALVVRDRITVADGVIALQLGRPDGGSLPEWTPGAHIDLMLADGLIRQYSLCGPAAASDHWQVAVLREPQGRGGSDHVHERLTTGTAVSVRGPRNNFVLSEAADYLFIAGGIGITPILPMIRQVARSGAAWTLLYGGRDSSSMAFVDELRAIEADSLGPGLLIVWPQDRCGLLPLAEHLDAAPEDCLVYCCGPAPLIEAVEKATASRPADRLRTERFSAVAVEGSAPAEGFEVELAGSGQVVAVGPDQTILEAVEEAGVLVLSSCQEGICGTCETGVLSGVPDHRDSILSEQDRAAGDVMMICVSRSIGPRLVLDL